MLESDKELSVLDYLPHDWYAPRREFFVQGFGYDLHIARFDAAPRNVTVAAASRADGGAHTRVVPGAKCFDCGVILEPDMDILRDHAKLHLAVKLAKEEILAAR